VTRALEKVAVFITRGSAGGRQLLLFEHPYAGIQIPVGTVDPGETPEQAALREAHEETRLTGFARLESLGHEDQILPEGFRAVIETTTVYVWPDPTSFDWVTFPRGMWAQLNRSQDGYSHITFEEPDDAVNPQYASYAITGWVPDRTLSKRQRRHFFRMETSKETADCWTVYTDGHHSTLFWALLGALPPIIPPQDQWLTFLRRRITF
jgi:8-oxo-dGTP pyrophosphatase MutT (NUDIX family)